jgi:putative restriction endonuclease
MRGYVAVTDNDWFDFLRSMDPEPQEVNFWRPSGDSQFKTIQPGEPVFFKLKSPRNAIGGYGFFIRYTTLPISYAWEAYGNKNGAANYVALHDDIRPLRRDAALLTPKSDFTIGCILLNFVTFFSQPEWVKPPSDFKGPTQQGKGYDLSSGEGQRLWFECQARAASTVDEVAERPEIIGGYGEPRPVRPRLGQHSFRVVVLDTYGRRCAVTSEKALPTLEAAHIRCFSDNPEHSINNGVLLRADVHRLFDKGYVTITPDYHFLASRKLKEDFENGEDYFRLHGSSIRLPENSRDHPAPEVLQWHNENRFLE